MTGVIDVGGGNRGAFGAGVLDYCLDHGIVFDYCIGVSAGSANCASYIAGQRGRNLRFYTKYNISREAVSIRNGLRNHSMLNLDYIFRTVSDEDGEDPLNYEAFARSGQICKIVTTDAQTGNPVFFDKQDVRKNDYGVLSASCNLPVVNRAYIFRGREYYDGGLSDPIPVRYAFDDGCDKVVAILTLPKDYFRSSQDDKRAARLLRAYPKIRERIINRASLYNRELEELLKLEKQGKVLIIAPHAKADMDTLGKNKAVIESLYREGYQSAEKILDFLK